LARRLVYYAQRHRTLPKRLEPRLVMLRDPQVLEHGDEVLDRLAAGITDHNFRIFAEGGKLAAIRAGLHMADSDPFVLFDRLQQSSQRPIDAAHAFYLGYEMAKAVTALTLGKEYRQDEALDWGFLTRPEQSHRAKAAKSATDPGKSGA